MKSLEQLVDAFPKLLDMFAKQLQIAWQVSLRTQFRDKDNKILNDTDTLRASRGGKSLIAQLSKKGKIVINDGKVQLDFETDLPYAGIQNRGGFIKATPVERRLKSGKTVKTYRMAQYFWAKSFEADTSAKKKIYMNMALGVQKRGGVKIKAKYYLDKSVKDLEENRLQNVLNAFFEQVLRIWNVN